jgi:phosphate transport system permease protein
MATTLERPPVGDVDQPFVTLSRRRRLVDRLATVALYLAFLVAAVPLLLVFGGVVTKGKDAISVNWFTKDIPANVSSATIGDKLEERFGPREGEADAAPRAEAEDPGMKPAIVGTLLITGLAALMAIPLGLLGAIYLNEYGKQRRLAVVIRFFTDVMTGVPSVIMGVFIYTVWVLHFKAQGRSAVAGALALGCLMLPVVVRSSEEMLRLVPNHLREASAALGARTWRTTLQVVLPAALPGVTSGCMLAVARAAGETAPLLFTIGSVTATNLSLSNQNTALATQIYSNATQPGGETLAWGAALTLIGIVLSLTLLARLVASRLSLR